ncbi:MAG: response regulator, partial [Planctomycetia bacterium]|nr:response regulator [Planctomycetia bacterium]
MQTTERVILHVDDDRLMTEIIRERLDAHGCRVIPINDPTSIIDVLVRNNCRVVLLDVQMPQANGLEIKQYDGGVMVIMLTGLVSMTSVLESMRRGAEACFFKPLHDVEPLVQSLDAAFQKIDHWWNTLQDLTSRRRDEKL